MYNVQVRGGYVLHVGKLDGSVKVGDQLKLYIDEVRVMFRSLGYVLS